MWEGSRLYSQESAHAFLLMMLSSQQGWEKNMIRFDKLSHCIGAEILLLDITGKSGL